MRVCLHTFWEISHGFIGGTERFLIELSKELRSLGYDPFIACTGARTRRDVDGVEVISSIPERYIPALAKHGSANPDFLTAEFVARFSWPDAVRSLSEFVAEQLADIEADVFHLNSFASAAHLRLPKPIVVTNHENALESDYLWGDGFFEFLLKCASEHHTSLHRHAALAVPSRHYAQLYTIAMGFPVLPVKQGIRLDTFPVHGKQGSVAGEAVLKLLLPSRFEPHQKGHDIAIEALEILRKDGIQAEITFTGIRLDHNHSLQAFRSDVHARGFSEYVHFTRYDTIQDAFDECDIVISPERYCSYGLSISESLALGIPTILSDIPTYKEIGLGYRHALFFKSGSAASLAEQVCQATTRLNRLERGEAIRFRAPNDLRECAKAYGALYQSAAEKR